MGVLNMRVTKELVEVKKANNYYELLTNEVTFRIWFLTDDIIRIRAGFDGDDFIEESYSLVLTAWEDRMDDLLGQSRRRIRVAESKLVEKRDKTFILGRNLSVEIDKNPFRITVIDSDGTILHRDIPDLAYIEDNNLRRSHSSEIVDDDYFYGFGEKTGELNKAETQMGMNPTDAMGFDPKSRDSLYKHIPFYIKLNKGNRKATGYFYHNTYACEFDMGREHSNYWHKKSRYRTDGGDIDLFLIAGPKIRDVVEKYTDLTGKSTLLPRYSLGYLGSSMYYAEQEEDADDAIVKFIETSHKEGIPIDGFQLSSGYSNILVDKKLRRSVFNWNNKRFKNPKKFFEEMKERNVVVSPNIKPAILLENPLYYEMKEKEMFITEEEGEPGLGAWWGGQGAYTDFTNSSTREHWKSYLKETILEKGTYSIWNDNCEYDGLIDDDYEAYFEGKPTSISQVRTVMSNLMCHTTEEAINEMNEEVRPFIVCRSGHAGIQRYAQTWAGDNYTSWDSLKYNIATILGMGLSGVSNHGCDIGGFSGPAPEPELFLRWVQHGIFQPRFSIHSTNTDNTVTEPWMYKEITSLIREAIQFRYQLSPYFYSLSDRANRTGLPMMEALVSAFQSDEKVYDEGIHFMLGNSLLVANIVEKGETTKSVYLPKGETFYDFYTRKPYRGGQTINYPVKMDSIPLFIKGGSILPIAENIISNLATDNVEDLRLICVPDKDAVFELYEDDGSTLKYQDGDYLRTNIKMKTGNKTILTFTKEGSYDSTIQSIHLDVIHPQSAPFKVSVDGQEIPQNLYNKDFDKTEKGWYYDQSLKSVQVKYSNISHDYSVEIDFSEIDLIGM
jgi:alpha-glucosidase